MARLKFVLLRTLCLYLIVETSPQLAEAVRLPAQTKLTNCRIVINEWNTGVKDQNNQYIELKAYCAKTPGLISSIDLSRYKIVVISAKKELVVVCHSSTRKRFTSRTEWYFTVGGPNVANSDMQFTDCHIDYFLLEGPKIFVPKGLTFPFALALLYNPVTSGLARIDLKNVGDLYQSKILDDSDLQLIKNSIQDMYIYGAQTPLVTCEVFKYLARDYVEGSFHTIRDWQTQNSNRDLSINRCSRIENTLSFQNQLMRHSNPTPNAPNDCDVSFSFAIENSLPSTYAVIRVPITTDRLYGFCDRVTNDPDGDVIITNEDVYENLMNIAEQSPSLEPMEIDEDSCSNERTCGGSTDDVTETSEFDYDVSNVTTLNGKYVTNDCSHFPVDWITALNEDTDKPIDVKILRNEKVCYWYEYIIQEGVGRCKMCHAALENGLIYGRQFENIATSGYMYRNTHSKNIKNINSKMVLNHANTILHQISEQYFLALDEGLRGAKLAQSMMDKTKPYRLYFESTEHLIVSVYQAVKMGLSFNSFEVFTDTLKYFEVKIGHVHSKAKGMRKVLMHIESMMRKDLVNFLLKTLPEVSITLDASTDIAGLPSLAVLFQTFVEGNTLKVFFYRLLPLSGDSGVSLFNSFREALVEDGLDEYIKMKLTGFVSDGCSVMTSTFMNELQKFTESGFINTWCMNHRLNLVSKNSLTKFPMIRHIESKVNELARFFGAISPKKRRVLQEAAKSCGFRSFEIHRIHDIRWSQSKNKALRSVLVHWPAIIDALEKISQSANFKSDAQTTAKHLLLSFKDGTFLSSMAFLQDATDYMSDISLTLQERGNTLIGKRVLMDALKSNLNDLKSQYGETLSSLLQNSRFQEKNVRRAPTLQEFELKQVQFKGKLLQPSGYYNDTIYLHLNIETYAENLVQEFEHYFPSTNTADFDVFNPPELVEQSLTDESVKDQLDAMNKRYRWGYDLTSLVNNWDQVVKNIVANPDYSSMSVDRPEVFWKHFLNFEDDVIGWHENTRSLIRRVLSVGSSSSEAERVFSVASAQKSKRRYNLKVETVNALVAIRFNGVKDIRKLDSYRYAKEFTKYYSRADDPSRPSSIDSVDDEDFFLAPFDYSADN